MASATRPSLSARCACPASIAAPRCRPLARLLLLGLTALLAACGPRWIPEDKPTPVGGDYQTTPDGYYRVRRGDSLYTIAFRYGLDWRDLAIWNGIYAPYTIYPDQELRMMAPLPPPASAVVVRPAPAPTATVTTEQVDTRTAEDAASETAPGSDAGTTADAPAVEAASGSAADTAPPGAAPSPPPQEAATPSPNNTAKAGLPVSASGWIWPTAGRILSSFAPNDPARKGIDIGGDEGQPVVAAAAGQVVYSGSGLIGYGELVIVKHNDRVLSAYAHNRNRLVSEGQQVAVGQQLAEMGRNDRNQAMLHFEIRVNGVPTDPLKYLPGR